MTKPKKLKKAEVKPCPFCGHQPDPNDPDMCYPSGAGWREHHDGFRSYHRYHEVPPEQWCYDMHCSITAGGCGAVVGGDSYEEAIEKWNKRV